MAQSVAVESGELANPEVRKSRRAHGAEAFGTMDTPGMPATPMKGARRNGVMGRDAGGYVPSAPKAASRRRGAR